MDVENVLFLGDSHGNTGFVGEAIGASIGLECKVILQLGDFGIWDHKIDGIKFLETVNQGLEEHDIILIFCDGNHENFDSLYALPVDDDGFRRVRKNIWHAPRGHIWEMGGVTFMAMGGAHSIDGPGGIWQQGRGPLPARSVMDDPMDLGGWWPQETITPVEAQEAMEKALDWQRDNGPIDVLIAHDCPAGVPIPGIHGYPAGDKNRHLLAQVCDAADPSYIFCGHYHLRHRGVYNNARVEILAADVNGRDQALAVSLNQLKKAPPEIDERQDVGR